jgi:hypothetical protein
MNGIRTMKTKTLKEEKVKKTKDINLSKEKNNKFASIVIGFFILFTFGYIFFDLFVLKEKIKQEVIMVNEKFDSLQLYLDKKIPLIDEALKIQEQQVKELQEMNYLYFK